MLDGRFLKYKPFASQFNIYGIQTPRWSPPARGGRSSFSVPGSPRTRANGGSCNIVFIFKDNKNITEKKIIDWTDSKVPDVGVTQVAADFIPGP
jgi:hypothetical protein